MERVVHGLREIGLFCYLALSLYLLLSLLTFDLEDPGWRHSGTGRPLANAGGLVGAWLADFGLSLLGMMVFLIPVMIVWHAVLVYWNRVGAKINWGVLALRWAGFFVTAMAGSGLAYIHFIRAPLDLPETTGGIVGAEIGEWLLGRFGVLGATLALLVVFLAGVTLFTGMSWLSLMESIGKYVLGGWGFVVSKGWQWVRERRTSDPEKMAPAGEKETPQPRVERKVRRAPKVALPEEPLPEVAPEPEPKPKTAVPEPAEAKMPKPNIPVPDPEPKPASEEPAVKPVIRKRADTKKTPEWSPTRTENAVTVLPPLELLDEGDPHGQGYSEEELATMSRHLESVLADFGVPVEVKEVHPGPVITRFEIKPGPGIKGSRISNLATDLARSLSVPSVRVVEVIPGKSNVGLEIPNLQRETVYLREILTSREYQQAKSSVTLVLGKDISGRPVVADLAKMPHLLVAGTTGSGKSVAINAMILSMVYKAGPEQVRMIMIDPKMLELSVYEGIPHLLSPVVTDMKEAASALRWCVAEMDRRYRLMSALKVRNLAGYNRKVQEAIEQGEPIKDPFFRASDMEEGGSWPILEPLPVIVVVIDELADMMMIVGKKVEELIARLAQKARAAGVHLILATQRPSVDVLTGLIKANVPTRIAFQVSSKVDSRTILDQGGAESLLGSGDMLYLPPGTGFPQRAHGAFVDDHEVLEVVDYLKQTGRPQYIEEITRFQDESESGGGGEPDGETDALYDDAVRFVTETRRVSISSVQRKFKIGYNRAARIVEDMERAGVVSEAEGNGSRTVLAPPPVED
ncbi:MAG: DNA translocase FtsK 4TM domain-containing protein [Methylohalobius sp. ZOD2]